MLERLLAICLPFALWLVLRMEETRLLQRGSRRLGILLGGFRGGLLGLSLAMFLATALTQAAGHNGQTPYYFATVALGLSMIGVTFGVLVAVMRHIKVP